MRRRPTAKLDLDLIFPIKDQPSARLMIFKAQCLYRAGVISKQDRQTVEARAVETCHRQAA